MEWTKQTAIRWLGLSMVLWLVVIAAPAASEYVIGPEDMLDITFWQEPTLNLQVRVGRDGNITIDIIGQIQAAGRTTEELQREIVRAMSRLNKNISQAAVRVTQYNFNYVFVIGQVNTPGKKTFEEIPDLWTLINESGGVAPQGDLSRVTILRGGQDAGKIEVVNVSEAIASGRLDKLPKIRREDTIEIPRLLGAALAPDLGATTERRNQICVIGAVNIPGMITYQENIDVVEALALAGGPTAEANLKKAQLVIKDGYYSQTVNFNLEQYSKTGKPARYIMQKEDMLIIPARRSGFLGEGIGGIAAAVGIITTAVLLYDRISGNNSN